jgi:hypothetical protein
MNGAAAVFDICVGHKDHPHGEPRAWHRLVPRRRR